MGHKQDTPIAGAQLVTYFDEVIMPKVVIVPLPAQSSEHEAIIGLAAEIKALNAEIEVLKAAAE